jgi:3-oxoadipate enol-lactonase
VKKISTSLVSVFALLLSLPAIAEKKNEINFTTIDSGYAEVNGTKLYYEMAGAGEPLVLIHGNFGDRRHWDFQFDELSKKYKVLRYDVRGYGKSALPKADEAYKDCDDLKAMMEFLEIKKTHLCGVSQGADIGVDFALVYPTMCISLIPIGPWVMGYGEDEFKTPASDSLGAAMLKVLDILKNKGTNERTDYLWAGNNVFGKGVVSPAARNALLKTGYEYSWWRYLNIHKRQYAFPQAIRKLNEIKIPTLVVTAEYDFPVCKEIANIIAKEIAGAKLISIKDAGHLMNMDNPQEFNAAITSFIDRIKSK